VVMFEPNSVSQTVMENTIYTSQIKLTCTVVAKSCYNFAMILFTQCHTIVTILTLRYTAANFINPLTENSYPDDRNAVAKRIQKFQRGNQDRVDSDPIQLELRNFHLSVNESNAYVIQGYHYRIAKQIPHHSIPPAQLCVHLRNLLEIP
jgi:hypothetical protein